MKKILVLLLLTCIAKSYCCDCAGKPSVEVNWKNVPEVFRGKVVKVDSLYGNNGTMTYAFTVKILQTFKNEFFKDREYRTILSQDSAACDFIFSVGKEYLIYAGMESQTLHCSICSRTMPMEQVDRFEIQKLEKLYKAYREETKRTLVVSYYTALTGEIEVTKGVYEDKIKEKNLVIYSLWAFAAILIIIILVISRIKIKGK